MAGDNDYYNPSTGKLSSTGGTTHASAGESSEGKKLIALATDEELYEQFVYPWRDTNSQIVRLWRMLDNRFRSGGAVGEHLSIEKVNGNKDRLIRLPSGRAIAYRRCGVQKVMVENKRGELVERERLTFQSPMGFRTDTYGGRLAENATQAVARDLMADAIVRLEAQGYPVVAHVHDEIIIEGEHDVDEIKRIMTTLPSWAEDMPVDATGFTCSRYRKG